MASTINATSSGSGGLISTGDASGQLELQANGSTKLTVSSSGVNIAGGIASPLIVTGNSTAGAELRLPEDTDNGSNYVALKAADSIASNLTFTLPSADGTSGQVIQTNGSGTLSFVTPAGGSWTYLSTVTASNSATADIETTFDSTYDMYALVAVNVYANTNATELICRLKIGGSYQTAGNYAGHYYRSSATTSTYDGYGTTSETFIRCPGAGQSTANNQTLAFVMYIPSPSNTTYYKQVWWQGSQYMTNNSTVAITFGVGMYPSASALTGVRFLSQSGNISGTFRLYGIKNS